MNEDDVRRLILDKLYAEYLKEPHGYMARQSILDAQGILGLDSTVIDRNVRYLQQKGVIDVQWFLGGEFMARLNAFGVDVVERQPGTTERTPAEPTRVLEDELDRLLNDHLPALKDEITATRDLLAQGDKPIDFQHVALECRNHLLSLADAVYRPEFLPKDEPPPDRDQIKRKVRFALRAMTGGKTEREFAEATIDQFEALVVLIQKGVHDREATRAEAAVCLASLEATLLVILRAVAKGS